MFAFLFLRKALGKLKNAIRSIPWGACAENWGARSSTEDWGACACSCKGSSTSVDVIYVKLIYTNIPISWIMW